MTSRLLRASALAAAVAAGLAAASHAEEPAACPAIDRPAPVFSPGVRAAVDPVTGEPRTPTAEERQAAAARRAAAKAEALREVRIVTHPNGMKTAVFGGAFLMDLTVETLPDGTAAYRCAPDSATPERARELK